MAAPSSEEARIELVAYASEWPELFAREKAVLELVLKPWLAAEAEHIGSTAVVGMSAKPIIDIMAPVYDLESSRLAIHAAQALHYCYYPYKPEQMHWFCKPSPAKRTHHLHLIPWHSRLWLERLAFRDALRKSATLAGQYELLKHELAARFARDRDTYTEGKSAFISTVLMAQAAAVQSTD
jgi:GrpB-like predicted nucleotidyltransferase (UPF0157 family)